MHGNCRPAYERFIEKLTVKDDGCWIWNAALNNDGYGIFNFELKCIKAHKFSYIHFKGQVPDGLEIDHKCRVRNCVNPDHLEAVTHAENVRRGDVGKLVGQRKKEITHCPRGHEYNLDNTYLQKTMTGKKHRSCKICRAQAVKKSVQKLKRIGISKP